MRLKTPEVAAQLGVCKQRVAALLKEGAFPNASLCECERTTLIPVRDVESYVNRRKKRK